MATLPAYVGVDLGDQGYAVVRITKLWGRDPGAADPAKAKEQYALVWATPSRRPTTPRSRPASR